ncbi:MAG: cytochrome c biogenesis protein CcdA [Acidimicrobiaceae bacterium]|nr:cytochrome c biogenesis CcdA family protein [Acidimicrobiaceae bacterium]MDE0515335.1 cytochrome c biogenesis CcdA family protein [Acidimicrobiaceae bacterium]MXZ94791.1 cytochrome c biogenesis protein CcdA [Acidimicrobiaceae bacterium]MYF43284.1 cytochrome c biogenesis protein CcdA [Acidimicrobiaceae bacterium]MYJ35720.1 cytochrome c biogenesis protein CcdA [Acidimicrobiaceae bacterium]
MDLATLAYPFSLGLVAAFNPCGFALLPAYLGYFIGVEQSDDARPSSGAQALGAMLRAMVVALTLTAGFVVVFGAFGALFETVLSQGTVLDRIGYVTIAIGAIMALLGLWLLAGRAINLRLPKMNRGTGSRGLGSVFMFGVSYAVVSLSCTIGLFIAAVATSFSADGVANGTANFVAYGVGMGAVITFLTLALALARSSVVPAMRKMFRWINPVSGLVLIASGIYVANYGWWELQVIDDPLASNVFVEKFTEFQAAVSNWIDDATAERIGVLCGLGVLGVLVLGWRQGETSALLRRTVSAAYVALYLVVEFYFNQAEFVVLPVWRFVAGWPLRIGHWFTDPARYGVPLEILFTALVLWIAWRAVRRVRHRERPAPITFSPPS